MSKRKRDDVPGVFEDAEDTPGTPAYCGPPVLYSYYMRPPKVKVDTGRVGGADQSFKDECDVNRIMERAKITGVLIDPVQLARATRLARYEDVSQVPETFLDAQLFVLEARESFDKLPSAVRLKFGNNVAALLEFLADESNREEAIRLGLVESKPSPGSSGASDKVGSAPPPDVPKSGT